MLIMIFKNGATSEKATPEDGYRANEGTLVAKTAFSPEKVHFGPGSEAILDVSDRNRTVSLPSAEGGSGFLVATEKAQTQFLRMSPGLYSSEHAHPYGFIIYTVEGRWVLCSDRKRCLLGPGSIYACRSNVPMGMEVPFEEGALVIFFLEGGVGVERRYEEYVKAVSEGTKGHSVSEMIDLRSLPATHPARTFAMGVNPKFFL